jgi:hypothetical protein
MRYIIVAILALLVFSCGVKTAPRSIIIETRPVIPFKETAKTIPTKEEKKEGTEEIDEESEKGDLTNGSKL